jgi:DNA-binding CsgD family transcriptional regulator
MANNLLSPREREVLLLLSQGLTTRQIAHTLHRSINTVATHRKHILEKFGVKTTAGALAGVQSQGAKVANTSQAGG